MTYRIATLEEVLASPPLIVDGWLVHPDFIRVDGVPAKVYTEPNTGENGLAGHSVVGEEPDFLDGVPNRFLSEEMVGGRFTAYAAASCQNILRKRMKHVVMYPVEMATWTSGSRAANCTTWASEAEGGWSPHNEPLTEHQMRGEIVVATAWEQTKKRRLTAADLNEHRHLVARFGGDATACASGRYREVFERILNGERYIGKGDDMTQEQKEELAALVAIFGGRDKLLEAKAAGMDYLLGYAIEQADQDKLEAAVAKLASGGFAGIPPGTRFTVEVQKS